MRRLVLDYYVVLRSVLRDKRWVRRLLTRCRHCGIFFIADPRNSGRKDLGCPFGCADLHRRRRSSERSVRYNSSAVGKLKRHQREEERRLAADRAAAEASQTAEVLPAATVEAAHGALSRSVEPLRRDRQVDHPCPSPEVAPLAIDQAARSAEATVCGPCRSSSSEDCGSPSSRERGPSAGSLPAEPEQLEFPPGIVAYVRVVISLLEGRNVNRVEILEMLARTRRQHSFARERRIDYVLRWLNEGAEKPP